MIELTYKDVEGLLHSKIGIGKNMLQNSGRFGKARLEYLHSQCFVYYRELLITGKLVAHCEKHDKRGHELAERLHEEYIERHPFPDDDFIEIVRRREQARDWAEEVIIQKL